jgi:myo-inositol catabolism protein IolC
MIAASEIQIAHPSAMQSLLMAQERIKALKAELKEWQDASPLEIIRARNPHMNMAAVLRKMERADAGLMPCLFGQDPHAESRAWGAWMQAEDALREASLCA